MSSSIEGLDLAQIVFYAIAVVPGIYCFWKHGVIGLAGWFYVLAMCGLRLAGNGLVYTSLKNTGTANTTGSIISSVGLSPLLLSVLGIIHEANFSIRHNLPFFLKGISLIFPHMVILAGIALAAASKGKAAMMQAGLVVLLLGWLTIVAILVASYRVKAKWSRLQGEQRLLQAMIIALPLVGVRVVYGVVVAFKDPQTRTASLPVQVIFSILPEFLAMIINLVSGIATRNLDDERKASIVHPGQIEAA